MRLQCVAALVLGAAVLLSALFWLPPFAGRGNGAEGPDPAAGFQGECLLPPTTGAALRDLAFNSGFSAMSSTRVECGGCFDLCVPDW